jgi:hypothetical protein
MVAAQEVHGCRAGSAWMPRRKCMDAAQEVHGCRAGSAWMPCRKCMDAVQEVHGCRAGSVVGAKTSYAPTTLPALYCI